MPPKPKFTREEVVQAALDIVSARGIEALTARELGAALGSSARPLFTVFKNMEELHQATRAAAMARFEEFSPDGLEDAPVFKQVGMRMVLFGMQEPKLYQLLFMEENATAASFDDVISRLGPTAQGCIDAICADYGLNARQARMLFENMWIYTFGIGALCAMRVCSFSRQQLGQMLTTAFQSAMMLIKSGNYQPDNGGQ